MSGFKSWPLASGIRNLHRVCCQLLSMLLDSDKTNSHPAPTLTQQHWFGRLMPPKFVPSINNDSLRRGKIKTMMRTLLIILCLTVANFLSASDEIRPYTVTAPSGLSLRSGPGTDHERIAVIPFNETVMVNLSQIDYDQQDTINEELGTWYPVTYGQLEGYLFSPYLKYGQLFRPADIAQNLNHHFRIVIPGIRVDALNYDPDLHWYALYKSPDDEQNPLKIKKVQPKIDLNPLEIEEEVAFGVTGEDVSIDADLGENYLLLFIGTRQETSFSEMITYYNNHYGNHDWGRPIYPNEQFPFWEASPTERYFLSGLQNIRYSDLEETDLLEYELGISENAGPSRYEAAFDQSISQELYTIWEGEEEYMETYVPTDYYYHPRLFWQGDVNNDGVPDLLFYLPDSGECCGGSESYFLLTSQKPEDGWEWKRAADDTMHYWDGC